MKYKYILSGKFIQRLNRFVAEVETDEGLFEAHVKNTGRCRELFLPGAEVFLEDHRQKMGTRRLPFSLIAVRKLREEGPLMVNTDSQAPNQVVADALDADQLILPGMAGPIRYIREQKAGNSRLDFLLEDSRHRPGYMEVKGVTLEKDGISQFPDAPTERGTKHVKELMELSQSGYLCYILFVLQMGGMKAFHPNDAMDPFFGRALREASRAGVHVLAYDCRITESSLALGEPVSVDLTEGFHI